VTIANPNIDRRAWTVPPAGGSVQGIDLAYLDPNDPDDRHFLILAEHPGLVDAIEQDRDEIEVQGHPLNPSMHLAVHEVVANQLWDDDPAEMWRTARRLVGLGYERHEVLHMLGSVVSGEIWEALRNGRPYDGRRYRTALEGLPESWERLRRP